MSFWRILKGLIPRFLFIVHSFSVVWGVTSFVSNDTYWLLVVAVVLLVLESGWMIKRKGKEYKWFCPSYLCYLCAVVPPIWILELQRLDRYRGNEGIAPSNDTEQSLQSVFGVTVPLEFTKDMWLLIFKQTLMFLLIMGRWMLPKGEITRGQLSQLLFVYIALGSDIMELFDLFDYTDVVHDDLLCYLILTAFTVSLLQFTMILTATKARKDRVLHTLDEEEDPADTRCFYCETEVWSIVTNMVMQDGPFFSLRVFTMYRHSIYNNTILFFTLKNGLVILVQLYRLMILGIEYRQNRKKKLEEKRKLKESLAFVGPYVSKTNFVEAQIVDQDTPDGDTSPNTDNDDNGNAIQSTNASTADVTVLVETESRNGKPKSTPNTKTDSGVSNGKNAKPAKGIEKSNEKKPVKKKSTPEKQTVYAENDTLTRAVRDTSQMLAGTALPEGKATTFIQYNDEL